MASQEHMEITLEFASDVFVSTKVLVMSCDFLNYSIVAVQNMFGNHLTFPINFSHVAEPHLL